MKELDPRTMLFIAACFSTLGVLIEKTWLLAIVFLFIIVFVKCLGADLFILVKRLKGLIYIILFVALMESVFNGQGRVLLEFNNVKIITVGGLLKGTNTLLRVGCVVASAAIFTLTTTRKMMQGLIQLKIPYEIAFMTMVALRFLPVFSNEFKDTFVAIQLRGVNINKIKFKEKIDMILYMIMPVTFSAIDKAQKLSYAMELRAFRAYPQRTSLLKLTMKKLDYFYIIIIFLVSALTFIYYIKYTN